MLDALSIVSRSKLCRHNVSGPIVPSLDFIGAALLILYTFKHTFDVAGIRSLLNVTAQARPILIYTKPDFTLYIASCRS